MPAAVRHCSASARVSDLEAPSAPPAGAGGALGRSGIIGIAMSTTSWRTPKRARSAEHNLPVPLTSLVGREREIEGISETLRRTRL